jgi:hypothetical protein
MPIYRVQSPDGRIHRFEGPPGASPDEVMAIAQRQFGNSDSDAPQPQKGDDQNGDYVGSKKSAFFGGVNSTVPFGRKMTSAMGAGIAKGVGALTGEDFGSFGDLYDEAEGVAERTADAHPKSNLAGVGMGLAATLPLASRAVLFGSRPTTGVRGALNAIPEAAAALGNFVRNPVFKGSGKLARTGNLVARMGKSAVVAAPGGALYGAGDAETGNELEGAGRGARMAAGIGAALPVAGAALNRLNTRIIIPNADKIRQKAGELFQFAENSGGVLKPEFTDKFVDAVEGFKPQTEIGRIVGGDDAFSKFADRLGAIRGRPMTLNAAQELDELLGDAIDGFTEMGRVTKQGKKLLDIQSTLRNMIDAAGDDMVVGGREGFDALKQARGLWATSHRLNDIERIILRADQYDQPATAIKTGFRTLYNNPQKMRGYSAAERKAIKKAAESGIVGDVLRTAGSRLLPLLTGASGGGLGATAAAQAGSMASRGMAAKAQLGRANKAARKIAERSGMVTQEKRIQIPDNWRELLRLNPREVQAVVREGGFQDIEKARLQEVMKMPPKQALEHIKRKK